MIVTAAWVLYAGFASERIQSWLGFAIGNRGVHIASVAMPAMLA